MHREKAPGFCLPDVAAETADIILVDNNPSHVPLLMEFSALTYRKMLQNLGRATGYDVAAIPLAAGVLYGWGDNNISHRRRIAHVVEHRHCRHKYKVDGVMKWEYWS